MRRFNEVFREESGFRAFFGSIITFALFMDIPINTIKNIKQFPIKATKSKMCTTVIFKLKGDLSKRYKLREQEYSNGIDKDGWLVIVNSGEDFNSLSTRLFKYDKDCVVVSPKYL